jgi:serine/threonine protein kinase
MTSPNPPSSGKPDPAALLALGLATQSAAAATAATPPLSPDELAAEFPRLEILELLGRGGMGAVYKARQLDLDRLVALKILRPGLDADPGFAERFTREARALAQLNHPGIVTLYEFGKTSAGRYFILMEFVDGMNLRQLLAAGRLSPREALAIVPPLCDALQYAHDRGLIHRDIKPENLLIDRLGRIKIADFGISRLASEGREGSPSRPSGNTSPILTSVGEVIGTPAYMAPEQRDRPAEVDHRADLYALGVVFYQMLTGELPSAGQLQPPSHRVQLDVRLDEIVLRALEKDPARRYAAASDFKTQVETVASVPAPSDSPAPTPVSTNPPQSEAGPAPDHSWRDLGWSLVPLVALLLAFFNPWGSKAWFYFGAGCAALALIPSWGLRFRLPRISPRYTRSLAIAPMVICVLGTAVYFIQRHASPAPQAWNLDVIVTDQGTWPPKTLSPERTLPVSAAALALLGSCDVRQPGSLEDWQSASAGPHLRLEYPRASEGKMPDVIVVTLPLSSGVIWTRKADKITRHAMFSPATAEKLAGLISLPVTGAVNLGKNEPVQLRALDWLDHVEGCVGRAWLPSGENAPEKEWRPPTTGVSNATLPLGTDAPRYLCLWFSHPAFDRLSVADVSFLNPATHQPLPVGDIASGFSEGQTPEDSPHWLTVTASPGTFRKLPERVEIQLHYSGGEWRFWDELPAGFNGRKALANGVSIGAPGQGADGRAFIELARDTTHDTQVEQFDFVALTQNGRRLERTGHSRTTTAATIIERFMFDAPLSQVRAFEIRKRPINSATWTAVLHRERILSDERSIRFDRAGDTMQNIVQRLRRDHGLRIAFENLDFTPADAVTLGARLRDLEAKAAEAILQDAEVRQLRDARRLRDTEKLGDDTLIDVGARYTGSFYGNTVAAFLDRLTDDTPYLVRKLGATWLIQPRTGSVLAFPVTLKTSGLTVDEAVRAILAQSPSAKPIGTGMVFAMPVAPGTDPTPWLSVRAPALDFNRTPATEALCRLTQAAVPPSVWELAGYRDARMLSLSSPPADESLPIINEAQAWLVKVDHGDYAPSWDDASPIFRNAITRENWSAALLRVRSPLGETKSRRLHSATFATQVPNVADGHYLVIEFSTDFSRKPNSVETLTYGHDPDGTWRSIGYFIR